MPIYEYACPHCRKTFEEWLKSDDEAHTHPCPTCGIPAPRIISHSTFILKGGGWYVTEYGSHHAETEAAEEHGTAPDAPGASDAPKDAGQKAESKEAAPAKPDASPAKTEAAKSGPAPTRSKTAPHSAGKSEAPAATPASAPASA